MHPVSAEGAMEGPCVRTGVTICSAEVVVLTLGKPFKAQISYTHNEVLITSCPMLLVVLSEMDIWTCS